MKADDWRRTHPWKDVELLAQPEATLRALGGDTLGELDADAPDSLLHLSRMFLTLGAIALADLSVD